MNTGDSDYPGIEQEWRASQPTAAATDQKARINWKLIFLLAAFGLLEAIIFHQEFFKALPLWVKLILGLLAVPGAFAGWIAKRVRARYFLHGFLAGLFNQLVSDVGGLVIGYFSNFSDLHEVSARAPNINLTALLVTMTISAIITSPILGLYYGLFAWVAGKIVKARGGK